MRWKSPLTVRSGSSRRARSSRILPHHPEHQFIGVADLFEGQARQGSWRRALLLLDFIEKGFIKVSHDNA